MPKHINKKLLFLLLGFTTLTFFNSARPMCNLLDFATLIVRYATFKCSSCLQKCIQPNHENISSSKTIKKSMPIRPNPEVPPTTTTIEDLPDDCLYTIFSFIDYSNKEILDLRFVSPSLSQMIEKNEKLFNLNLDKYQSFYASHQNTKKFSVNLKNKKNAEYLINTSPHLSLDHKNFEISLRLNEDSRNNFSFLIPWLQKLGTHLKIKENTLTKLSIHYPDPKPPKYKCFEKDPCTEIHRSWQWRTKKGITTYEPKPIMSIKSKTIVYNKEFNMFHDLFGTIDKLVIERCKNFSPPITWPKNLAELAIRNCFKFKIEYLKNLPKLSILTLESNDGVCKDNALEKVGLKNLKSLSILYYPNFTGKGLPEKLSKLWVKGCKKFDENSESLKTLEDVICKPHDECSIL